MHYHSHIGQDQWVAETFRFKRGGYFLDFGALDGVLTSNTLTLERDLGWTGICVEANPTSYPAVCRNRSCVTINAALWPHSRQTVEMCDAHGLSSVMAYAGADKVAALRESITQRQIVIDTINPTELLDRFAAPPLIEYMSLDIEGCELDVLRAMDFSRYRIALMTIEHSEVPEKQAAIRAILRPLGYEVIERYYDDWFHHPGHLAALADQTTGAADPVEAFWSFAETYPIVSA